MFDDEVSFDDIQDAVDDGATVPSYDESRLAKLDINPAQIEALSEQVEELLEGEEGIARRSWPSTTRSPTTKARCASWAMRCSSKSPWS
ncbi:MAG: hypothetical protein NZ552_00030 [Planctomycetes bacterium]|nr:hypothetical protein [Planctomycetota bacterium]